MEKALIYELIIRTAFNYHGRTFLNGAEADLFRGLERRYVHYKEVIKAKAASKISDEDFNNSLYEYAFHAGQIATYLDNAVTQIISNPDTPDEDKEKLKSCKSNLFNSITIEEIDKQIDQLKNIVLKME